MRYLLFFSLVFLFIGCSKHTHPEHTLSETSGLSQTIDVAPDEPIELSFQHKLPTEGEISFRAPYAVANVPNDKGVLTPIMIGFSIYGDKSSEYYSKIQAKISEGIRPLSVGFEVTSITTYGEALEKVQTESIEVPGQCIVGFDFLEGGTISSGQLECMLRIVNISSNLTRNSGGTPLHGPLDPDCHSHWGIGQTDCHCETTNCCNTGEKCVCDVFPSKKTSCSGLKFCWCG